MPRRNNTTAIFTLIVTYSMHVYILKVAISSLCVGAEFISFSELEMRICRYESENFVELYIRSSRTIDAMKKRAPKKNFAPQLLFGDLQYACIHGGQKYKSKSTGARPQQHTFQLECPFQLKISSSVDSTRLMVKVMNEQHNHEMSENAFKHLPRERRLCGDAKTSAETALKMRCNKKFCSGIFSKKQGR